MKTIEKIFGLGIFLTGLIISGIGTLGKESDLDRSYNLIGGVLMGMSTGYIWGKVLELKDRKNYNQQS